MSLTEMCLCFLVTRDPGGAVTDVLLGRKKDGFGAGNIVGLGGHVEPGETAAREVAEEGRLVVDESDLTERASVIFRFPARPGSESHRLHRRDVARRTEGVR